MGTDTFSDKWERDSQRTYNASMAGDIPSSPRGRGALNDGRFGSRMRGEGNYAGQMKALFDNTRNKLGLLHPGPPLSSDHFRRPGGDQLDLFDPPLPLSSS